MALSPRCERRLGPQALAAGVRGDGSAAAVAARMCRSAGIEDRRLGAAPGGLYRHRRVQAHLGRGSRYGVVPVSWNLDIVGWLARFVEDAALLLQVMAGPDAKD